MLYQNGQTMSLPDDTILDREPIPQLRPDSVATLKQLYLDNEYAKQLLTSGGATPAQVVDAFELLRREGLVRVIQTDNDNLALAMTQKGEEAGVLLNLMDRK